MTERKLFKVRIGRNSWFSEHSIQKYVEAENHEQAANYALNVMNEEEAFRAEVTHVAFAEVQSTEGGTKTTEFKGNGTQEFLMFKNSMQARFYWVGTNIPAILWAGLSGFVIAAIIFRGPF